MYVTLDEAKDQVSVARETTDNDERLTRLIEAAERAALQFLNADTLEDFQDSPVQSPPQLFEDVKSAILLLIELEFDRDERNMELLKTRAHELLWPYRTGLEV